MKNLFTAKYQLFTALIFMLFCTPVALMSQWDNPGAQKFVHGSTNNPQIQGNGGILELVEQQEGSAGAANGLKFSKQNGLNEIAEGYLWFQTNTNGLYFGPDDNSGAAVFFVDSDNGNTDIDGNLDVLGEIEVMSDARLKKDVVSIEDAISTVQKLNPVEYHYKTTEYQNEEFPEGAQMGFLAQELAKVYPGLVSEGRAVTNDAGESVNVQTVNYLEIIPLLTKAIQDQQAIIENLNSTVTALKAEVHNIKQSTKPQLVISN